MLQKLSGGLLNEVYKVFSNEDDGDVIGLKLYSKYTEIILNHTIEHKLLKFLTGATDKFQLLGT